MKMENLLLVVGIIVLLIMVAKPAATPQAATTPAGTAGEAVVQCAQNPSYTYSGRDSLNGVSVGGTDQIKVNGLAPVTSGNPIAGKALEYWRDNTTGALCDVVKTTGQCGTQIIQTPCYKNSSTYALIMYDQFTALTATTTTGTGATNLSIAANGVGTIKMTLQATAKQSLMPFGGCIAVEYPNTVTSISMTGALSSAASCPYQWTYSAASTSNVYKLFAVPDTFDRDGKGEIKTVDFQLQNGGTDITAGNFIVKLQPANHYVGNDGKFYLDIENKENNGNTVQTGGYSEAIALS